MKAWTDEECDALVESIWDNMALGHFNTRLLIRAAVAEARREQREADVALLRAGIPLRHNPCCKEAVAGMAEILSGLEPLADKEPTDV